MKDRQTTKPKGAIMAKEITDKMFNALVAEIKKDPGNSERHYAEKTGIPQGQIGSVLYKAELEADPSLKLPATQAGVVKGRNQGLRWPRIAAYTGLSIAKVKELAESGGVLETYTGRGRKFNGDAATPAAKRGTSGRATKTKTAPAVSGRRGAAKGKTAPASRTATAAKRGAGRRGTRAAAKASDPR